MLSAVIRETGYSLNYVLWRVSWLNLMMLMSDRPGLSRKKSDDGEGKGLSGNAFVEFWKQKEKTGWKPGK